MMTEIGIVGAKNSGKTTLIEALLPLLTARGLKVASIKHTGHDHSFDTEGKDSFRHRAAGAGFTMAISQSEMAIFTSPKDEFIKVAKEIISKHFDLCLVEGNKKSSRESVLLTRNIEQLKSAVPENIIVSYGSQKYSDEFLNIELNDTESLSDFLIEKYFFNNPNIKGKN